MALYTGKWYQTLTQLNGEQQLKALKGTQFLYEVISPITQAKASTGALISNSYTMSLGTSQNGISIDDVLVIKHPFQPLKTVEVKVTNATIEQNAYQMGKQYHRITVSIRSTALQ